MKKGFLLNWLRNVSIPRKLYFTVGIMGLLIMVELATLSFAVSTLSAVRAYVGGEGLWSKGQKDAAYSLQKYGQTHNEKDYTDFKTFLKVPLGDHAARLELEKKAPDLNIVRQGFLDGRLDPADIDGAIKLVRRFHKIYYINKAINVWAKADISITILQDIGDRLHAEITAPSPSQEKIKALIALIDPVNDKLTHLEDDFSYTLGEGSRWLENLIFRLLFGLVLTVEVCGLSITIAVSRGISRGLNEIITSAGKISKGDLKVRAKVYSNDEIGVLANSFNEMTATMDQMTTALTNRNMELEQFTHIVSHNLRSQTTTLIGLTNILNEVEINEDERKEVLAGISHSARQLDAVLVDLNAILKVKNGWDTDKETIDFQKLVKDITTNAQKYFVNRPFSIKTDFSAVSEYYSIKNYMHSIFYNLISNSIKFGKAGADSVIEIKSELEGQKLILTFKDNGIGLDLDKTGDSLFGLYKRFNLETEGSGVGLFMVKTQVEKLAGKVSISSEENIGTEFRIELPAQAPGI